MSTKVFKKGSSFRSLPWIGPATLLIFVFVLWPVVELFLVSFREISVSGLIKGWAGTENYKALLDNSDLSGTLRRTAIWLVVVVTLTMALSLPLAQLMNANFRGRRFLRYSVIVPWAASLVITATSLSLIHI